MPASYDPPLAHQAQCNLLAQQYLGQQQAQQNQLSTWQDVHRITWLHPVEMTATDLGIVDELLDDKIGMEP